MIFEKMAMSGCEVNWEIIRLCLKALIFWLLLVIVNGVLEKILRLFKVYQSEIDVYIPGIIAINIDDNIFLSKTFLSDTHSYAQSIIHFSYTYYMVVVLTLKRSSTPISSSSVVIFYLNLWSIPVRMNYTSFGNCELSIYRLNNENGFR